MPFKDPQKQKEYKQKWDREHVKERGEYYQKNKERISRRMKEYHSNNSKKHNEQSKKHYLENRGEILKKRKIYYQENKEQVHTRNLRWKRANPEKNLEHTYKFRKKHPEKVKEWNQRRFNSERAAGKLTLTTLRKVKEENIKKYGVLTCIYCLIPIQPGQDSLDHLVPVSRGGTNEYENLSIACRKCNSKKRTRTHDEYFEYLKSSNVKPLAFQPNPILAICRNEG